MASVFVDSDVLVFQGISINLTSQVGKLSILLEESCREVERFRIQAEKLEVENSHLRTQLDVSEKQLSASLQLCEQASGMRDNHGG